MNLLTVALHVSDRLPYYMVQQIAPTILNIILKLTFKALSQESMWIALKSSAKYL